jgi:cell wall-associated NlpC family hydrolase
MSLPRSSLLALALVATGCAGGSRAVRATALPPPATESPAGTRDPGAGPAPASPLARPSGAATPSGTATAPAPRVEARRLPRDAAVRQAIDTADALVGQREIVVAGVRWGDGCVALVRAAFAAAGAPLPDGDLAALLALARDRGGTRKWRAAAGDLVFLADRPGGPAAHVGLVASVAEDGTALVLHHTERGVARLRVNAANPWKARTESGKALNDVLLVGAGRVTAGRLLVGYATIL